MKIIDKLSPEFLRKYDQKLLLNRPVLWVLKLHHLLFFQLVLSLVFCLFSWAHPQSLGNYPHDYVVTTVIAVINILVVLLWIFYANQFDLRTRHISKPSLFDQFRVGSYLLAGLFVVFNALACFTILQVNTTKIVFPLDDKKFSAMDSVVNDFVGNGEGYADGFYLESVYHKETGRFLRRDTILYHPDTVLRRCKAIGRLNKKFGDGVHYSGAAIYDSIIDSTYYSAQTGRHHSISFYSRIDCIDVLRDNVSRIDRSFRFLRDMPNEMLEFSWISIFTVMLILGILYLLIIYFKYFGIYQVITGVLSPTLLFLMFMLIAFVWYELLHQRDEQGILIAMVVLPAIALFGYFKGFKATFTSKMKIVMLQSIIIVVPILLFAIYFEAIEGAFKCWQYDSQLHSGEYKGNGDPIYIVNPEYLECTAKQRLLDEIGRWVFLMLYVFVLFPLNLKMFYKHYYLPKK